MSTHQKHLPLVLLLLLASSLAAQTYRASLRGTISDSAGAVIPGAQVRLTSLATADTRTTVSGREGEFAISSLLPGRYRLEVEMTNFQKHGQRIEVLVNQEQRLDITLLVKGPDEQGIDAFYEPMVKKDSASIGTVIENRQIVGLPLDGRNFYELTLLVPGAVPAAQGSAGSARGDFAFSVNGAREDANNFLLDGVYNVDPKLNTFGVRPPIDAIHEFEMLTSSYDAAFGRGPGAQVNVVLRSGGNYLHGSLFEFHRNGALDARNFFAPATES